MEKNMCMYMNIWSFSDGSDSRESACSAGDPGSYPWVGEVPWRREWLPTPVVLLENPMDRGAWWAKG